MYSVKKIPSWITLLGCETVALIILFLFGFKFTYAPELENSWNAVSAFATWAGVVASTFAILVAIQIPKKIAIQQNKIALFEKRYEFYSMLSRCLAYANSIESAKTSEEAQSSFLEMFCNKFLPGIPRDEFYKEVTPVIWSVKTTLEQGEYLFPFEMSKEMENISTALFRTAFYYSNCDDFVKARDEYLKQISCLTCIDSIKTELKITL